MKKSTKGIIAIGVSLAILGFILSKIKKKGSVLPEPYPNPDPNGGGGGGGGTTTPKNFTMLANDLFDCFDNYGTAWDDGPSGGVLGIIGSLKSDAEFDALKQAYGIRKINCGTFNPFCTDFEGNMISALNNELDESELNELNDLLKKKGINRSI